jgi:hypothetical protein
MTEAEFQKEMDFIQACAEQAMEEEADEHTKCMKIWTERVYGMMGEYDIDFATAVRWDMQAHDCEEDFDHYSWNCGLSTEDTESIRSRL